MAEEKAIVVQDFDVSGTAIEMYGGRSMLRELTSRLMGFHPAAREVGEPGMLAVAQLAVLVGANPLPSTNEIHVWTQRDRITIDLGINYFRRRANELGGVYWVEQPRVMTDREYTEYGIDARQQIGAIAKGARIDKIRQLLALGLPFEAAVQGNTRIGVGTVSRGAAPKQGRPLSWTALKAAEKDLCRALFPNLEQPDDTARLLEIVPAVEPDDGDWPGETLNGEEAENLARLKAARAEALQDWDAMTGDEKQDKFERNNTLLHGEAEFEGFDTPPEPEPEPEPETNGKAASVKTQNWTEAGKALANATPYFQNKDGTPNWYHLVGAAGKLGFKSITDQNLDDVLDALRSYAAENQAEQQQLEMEV